MQVRTRNFVSRSPVGGWRGKEPGTAEDWNRGLQGGTSSSAERKTGRVALGVSSPSKAQLFPLPLASAFLCHFPLFSLSFRQQQRGPPNQSHSFQSIISSHLVSLSSWHHSTTPYQSNSFIDNYDELPRLLFLRSRFHSVRRFETVERFNHHLLLQKATRPNHPTQFNVHR